MNLENSVPKKKKKHHHSLFIETIMDQGHQISNIKGKLLRDRSYNERRHSIFNIQILLRLKLIFELVIV